jgi:hypothetical protein
MPRPRELFGTGDPITTDFAYRGRLGDRKAIEEITKVWNKLVIDRSAEMEEWMPAMQKLLKRPLTFYWLINNYYGGTAFESARLFGEMLDRTIRKRIAELARSHSTHARQTQMF